MKKRRAIPPYLSDPARSASHEHGGCGTHRNQGPRPGLHGPLHHCGGRPDDRKRQAATNARHLGDPARRRTLRRRSQQCSPLWLHGSTRFPTPNRLTDCGHCSRPSIRPGPKIPGRHALEGPSRSLTRLHGRVDISVDTPRPCRTLEDLPETRHGASPAEPQNMATRLKSVLPTGGQHNRPLVTTEGKRSPQRAGLWPPVGNS